MSEKTLATAVLWFYVIFIALFSGGCAIGKATHSIQASQTVVLEANKTLEQNVHQAIDDLRNEAKDGRTAAIGIALKHEGERIGNEAMTPSEAIKAYQDAEAKAAARATAVASEIDSKVDERLLMLSVQFATQRQFALIVDAYNKAGLDVSSLTELSGMITDLAAKAAEAKAKAPAKTPDPNTTQMKTVMDLIKQNASQYLINALTKPAVVK